MEDKSKYITINDDKLSRLLKNSYNIIPLSIIKEDDTAYLINTDSGTFLLYKAFHKQDCWLKSIYLQGYIKGKGFLYTPDIVKSTGGRLYVKYSHSIYYLQQQVSGHNITISNIQECQEVCKLLGAFHSYSIGFKYDKGELKDTIRRLNRKLQDKRAQAFQIKSTLVRKRLLTDFDRSYLSRTDELDTRLRLCSRLIYSYGYEELCQDARQKHCICHNSLLKSLYRTDDNSLLITSFGNASIGLPVYELSQLLKKLLDMDICCWSFSALKSLIDAYTSSRPMSQQEYGILLSLLTMPDKLLSIGKRRYIKQKRWSEKKYSQRLERAVWLFQKQSQLVPDYSDAYKVPCNSEKL